MTLRIIPQVAVAVVLYRVFSFAIVICSCLLSIVVCCFSVFSAQKGFWSSLLGVGDFYYELGVQIIDICRRERSKNGGLMALNEVLAKMKVLRGRSSAEIAE